jgi:replicative DNA helicase
MAQLITKLPPQNIDAEQSLLGALLIDKDAIVRISEILHPTNFYRSEQHGFIFEAIQSLFERREPIDLVTVTEELKRKSVYDKVGGSAYLASLINIVPTSAHIEHYAKIIKDHAVRRNLIAQATALIQRAYNEGESVEDLLETAEAGIFSISQEHVSRDFLPIKDALTESFDRLDELQKSSGKLRGVPTGFRDLDNKLAGMQNSNLIILASRPGQGKCLAYDSKIVNPDTGEVITIEEYYIRKLRPIFTLANDFQIRKTDISNFVDDGFKEVYSVRTATGREIEVTLSHPFLTAEGWKKLSAIKVGDRIATPRKIPVFGSMQLEDYKVKAIAYFLSDGGLTHRCPRFTNSNQQIAGDFVESIKQFDNVLVRKYDSNGTRTPSFEVVKEGFDKKEITGNFSQKLKNLITGQKITQAYLATELNASTAAVSMWAAGYVIPSQERILMLASYFNQPQEFFLPKNFLGFQAKNSVTLWLEELNLMGKSALEKRIPQIIFTLTKEKLALFLNRIFACDGSVYFAKRGWVISFASSSKEMIYDMQHLLLRFGIISSVRVKNVKYKGGRKRSFELEIKSSSDIMRFCQEIGIFSKEAKIAQAAKYAKKAFMLNNFTKDTLPLEIWNLIIKIKGDLSWRELYRRMGLPLSHNIHAGKRHLKRSTLLKIAQALQSKDLEELALSDIFWDKIVSIKHIGRKQVYDLTIPETHNFTANDFFVHNTSMALNIAQYVAVNAGLPVGIFSLEMSQEELVDRLLVGQADIDAWKLKTGRLDEKDFDKLSLAMGELAEAPIFIDDTPGITISEMRTKARRLQIEHGLKLLIVDYLQLVKGRNLENRVQEVSEISQNLKNLARELKVPVLAISQLSRAVEQRGTRRPQLADLRESGAIEQDADVVMFIYREDVENPEQVTLDVQKHRNGATGDIQLIFRADRTKFYGLEKARSRPKEESKE